MSFSFLFFRELKKCGEKHDTIDPFMLDRGFNAERPLAMGPKRPKLWVDPFFDNAGRGLPERKQGTISLAPFHFSPLGLK